MFYLMFLQYNNLFKYTNPEIHTLKMASNTTIPTECFICTERINKNVHKNVRCLYCDFDACRKCCERYVLQEVSTKCMNPKCNKEWTRKFMRENFTLKFLNTDFKEKKEKLLFEIEKAMLPATQQFIENEKKKIELRKELFNLNETKESIVLRQFVIGQNMYARDNGKSISNELSDLSFAYNAINVTITKYKQLLDSDFNAEVTADMKVSQKYVIKCGENGCRGYINANWKCDLCENWTCKDCHEIKGKHENCDHVCNPDIVASEKLIKKDSKQCPACSVMIFKIEGCDQMFCTGCKTAFYWKTGKIAKDAIHNPHYFEYINQRDGSVPRNPADVVGAACHAGLLGTRIEAENFDARVFNLINEYRFTSIQDEDKIMVLDIVISMVQNITQGLREMNSIHLVQNRTDVLASNQDLRVQYLKGEKSEAEFKKVIVLREKKQEKKREMYNIYNMCLVAGNDIFARFLETGDINTFSEFDNLRIYANECISEVNKIFASTSKTHINEYFKVTIEVEKGETRITPFLDMLNITTK